MENNYSKNERQLVEGLSKGCGNSFNTLFSIYAPRLYAFANGYIKSKLDTEDVVQEVFFIVWRKRKDIDPCLSFKSYLFKIAYHLILETFNKVRKRDEYKEEILGQSIPFSDDLDKRLDYQMLLEKVDSIINRLPARQRSVLIMRKKQGLAIAEIASKLQLSPKTVKNHLTEALKSLKKELKYESFSVLLFFAIF